MALILDGLLGETFPSWTTATRPVAPAAGQVGYNSSLGGLETYNGTAWITTIYSLPAPSTTGNVLTSNGTNWSSSAKITFGTSQASTSGTSIPFTGIPSWVKRIIVIMNGVTCSASFGVRLGTSGGLVATGYVGGSGIAQNGNTTSVGAKSTGFFTEGSSTITGIWTIVNFSDNNWTASWTWSNGGNAFGGGSGSIALSGVLTQLAITGGTFSAGAVNILYE
jgi:hypothetical protein